MLFNPTIALADIVLSLLLAMLTASAGVVVSIRSATVQEASQTLMAFFLVPVVIVQVVLAFFLRDVIEIAETLNGELLLALVVGALVVLNVAVGTIALTRYQRSRLILS